MVICIDKIYIMSIEKYFMIGKKLSLMAWRKFPEYEMTGDLDLIVHQDILLMDLRLVITNC